MFKIFLCSFLKFRGRPCPYPAPLCVCPCRFVIFYASPKIGTKDKLEKIIGIICIEKGSITVLASYLNLDFNTQEGEDFVKALKVEDLE